MHFTYFQTVAFVLLLTLQVYATTKMLRLTTLCVDKPSVNVETMLVSLSSGYEVLFDSLMNSFHFIMLLVWIA